MTMRLDPKRDAELLRKLGLGNLAGKPKGKSLYRTRGHVDADGFRWASNWEYECWLEIRSLMAEGEVLTCERQRELPLEVGGERIAKYTVDFVLTLRGLEGEWLLDAKSRATLKHRSWARIHKHVRAQYRKKVYTVLQGETNVKQTCLQMRRDALT